MAQAGQYNYGRCMKRGDSQAAYLACGEFIRTSRSIIYFSEVNVWIQMMKIAMIFPMIWKF